MPIITADPLLDVRTEMLFDPTKDATMDGELIDDLMSSESKIFAISKEHNIYKGPVFGQFRKASFFNCKCVYSDLVDGCVYKKLL